MTERRIDVVTGFLMHAGRVLLLKRSSKVGTYQGCWAGVSGYLEDKTPLEQIKREIREELGLDDSMTTLKKSGELLKIDDGTRCWNVHPFCFILERQVTLTLDWEHEEYRWVKPDEIQQLETVPGLWEAYCRVSAAGRGGA